MPQIDAPTIEPGCDQPEISCDRSRQYWLVAEHWVLEGKRRQGADTIARGFGRRCRHGLWQKRALWFPEGLAVSGVAPRKNQTPDDDRCTPAHRDIMLGEPSRGWRRIRPRRSAGAFGVDGVDGVAGVAGCMGHWPRMRVPLADTLAGWLIV